MPYYDYVCLSCNHTFEENMMIADMDLPTKQPCPSCGKKKVDRQFAGGTLCYTVNNKKPDSDFRSKMNAIKKAHRGSTIQDW